MNIGHFYSKYKGYLKPLISGAVILFVVIACYNMLKEVNLQAIKEAIRNIPISSVGWAFVATAVSFLMLFGYEWSANKYVKGHLTLKNLAFGSFCSFAVSNALGLAVFSGGTIRYRLYKHHGLDTLTIAKISLFASFAFNVTVPLLVALLILLNLRHVGALFRISPFFLLLIAILIISVYVLIVVLVIFGRLPQKTKHTQYIQIGSYRLEIPNTKLSIIQFAITSLDIIAAGTTLYLLLPDPPSYTTFLIVYCFALAAGAISNIPAGLGAFESVLLAAFSATTGTAEIMAALVLYRLVYTIIPFFIASVLLLHNEFRKIREKKPLRFNSSIVPPLMGLLVFLAGFLLILSGSTPEIYNRLKYLGFFLPAPLIDTFHLIASLIGVLCLLLAQGLYKRLSGAWVLTLALLVFGGIFSLLKGFDWEEASILFVIACLLYVFKPSFYRTSRLTQMTFTLEYLTVIACILILSLTISFFSYKNIEYTERLWWEFSLDANISRSFRAFAACAILLMFFALRWLLRSSFKPVYPNAGELARAKEIILTAQNPDAGLALSGDKMLLFNEEKDAFMMYGHYGKSLIALFDPIGTPEKQAELIWQFKEMCDQYLFRPIFYQVEAKHLSMYMDLGLAAIKIGEEAIVNLPEFSLESKASRELRYTYHRGQKDGASLEIYDPGKAPMQELKEISEEWLTAKNVREKGFSLGRYDVGYLNHFRIAVIRQNERIIAFANLFETDHNTCASIDLMRYRNDAPKSIMLFLLVSLILNLKENGFQRFSLGMAPLSGLVVNRSSHLTQKITSFLYKKGSYFYNFQGLRRFKEKLNPQWESRYIAVPRDSNTLLALAETSMLIAGGVAGIIKK